MRRTLGVNFSRHVLAKTATMQRINAPSIFNLMPSNLTSSIKTIAETDVNRPGNFEIPLQLFFMTQSVQFCTLQIGSFLQMPAENQ